MRNQGGVTDQQDVLLLDDGIVEVPVVDRREEILGIRAVDLLDGDPIDSISTLSLQGDEGLELIKPILGMDDQIAALPVDERDEDLLLEKPVVILKEVTCRSRPGSRKSDLLSRFGAIDQIEFDFPSDLKLILSGFVLEHLERRLGVGNGAEDVIGTRSRHAGAGRPGVRVVSIEVLVDLEGHWLAIASKRLQIGALMRQDGSIVECRVQPKIRSGQLDLSGLAGETERGVNQRQLGTTDDIGDAHSGNTNLQEGKIDFGIGIAMGLDPESMDPGEHPVALLVPLRGVFDAEGWFRTDVLTSEFIQRNPGRGVGQG